MKITAIVGALTVLLAACGDDDDQEGPSADGVVDVVTAQRLQPMVEELAAAFTDQSDADVEVTTVEGEAAVADTLGGDVTDVVIAPAPWVPDDADGETVGRNLAVMAVAEGNPDGLDVTAFAPDAGADTLVCGEDTILGNFSLAVLAMNGVSPNPETVEAGCEQDALTQIAAGDLDAALMFRTSLDVPDGVELIEIDDERNIVIDVEMVAPGGSGDAESFVQFVTSEDGQAILEEEGFLP